MTKHFVFATESEAEKVIIASEFVEPNLYQKDNHYIFICGIGELSQKNFLSYIQSDYVNIHCDCIINLGIAGACNDNLVLETVYQIKNIGHGKELLNLSENYGKKSLCTTIKPVWEKEAKLYYAQQGYDLIDMEAFFLAKVCQKYDLDIEFYKLVSDYCQRITKQEFRKKLPHFAHLLLDLYKQLI